MKKKKKITKTKDIMIGQGQEMIMDLDYLVNLRKENAKKNSR